MEGSSMSWDKGDKTEKEMRAADFLAAIESVSKELMRYDPTAGVAAIAYMVALTRILKPKIPIDKMIKHYEGKIKEQMGDALELLKELHKEARTPEDVEDIIAIAQAFLKNKKGSA
jgi:predicted ATP-grasp superfamily ATP-dependent carboligase